MSVSRPLWSFFIPRTPTATLRGAAFAAPTILFGVATTAIVLKQSFYRTSLLDEDAATWDRIDRRAYVALPDGKMALVFPIVHADTSLCGMWRALKSSVNPMP